MADDWLDVESGLDIPGLCFRRFRGESDYASIAEVLTGSQRADGYDRMVTREDIAAAYAASLRNCDPRTDMVMAEVAGRLVGKQCLKIWQAVFGLIGETENSEPAEKDS